MTSLRASAFWLKDRLAGNRVKSELQYVEEANEDRQRHDRQQLALAEQLEFARNNIPYYRHLTADINLSDFPVINKSTVRDAPREFIASGVETERMHVASTSGSTGTPFRALHDVRKRRRIDAEAIYFGRKAGYHLGTPLFHLKIWSSRNRRSRLSFLLRNIVPVDVATFDSQSAAQLARDMIRRRGQSAMIAYSSVLDTFARAADVDRIITPGKLVAVIGQSEALSDETRWAFSKRLGVYPVGRYGLEELGIVAQQDPHPDGSYILNLASHFVEILQEGTDLPTGTGELGRIVVTDLVNRAQPLIRYDTGDLGAFAKQEHPDQRPMALARIEGRRTDRIYDVDDRPLSSMIIYKFWWKYPELMQYQLVQEDRGTYLLRISVAPEFQAESALLDDLRAVLGANAQIGLEYSNDGYVMSSGKRKTIVSEYDPAGSPRMS